MENKMNEYLGDEYNYRTPVKNYLKYVLKGLKTKPAWENTAEGRKRFDAWRKENDLDCIYFGGDLNADTLISAWTPTKWVLDLLNEEKFRKPATWDDPNRSGFEELLANTDKYLPPEHDLVKRLNYLLYLTEKKCNYIILPKREMNRARYSMNVNGGKLELFDEVPAMLWHVFDPETLGSFFANEDGSFDEAKVVSWIREEHLTMGFEHGIVAQDKVRPLIHGLAPKDAKWLKDEDEIRHALDYMNRFLEQRENETELMVSMFTNPKQKVLSINKDGSIAEPEDGLAWGLFKDGIIRKIPTTDAILGDRIYAWDRRLDKFDVYMCFGNYSDEALRELPPLDAMLEFSDELRYEKKYGYDWSWFNEPPIDDDLKRGNAYDLTDLIFLGDDIQLFILDDFGNYNNNTIDLGMKRYLNVGSFVHLIIVRDGKIISQRLKFKNGRVLKLADVLKKMGFESKISVSLYLGATKPLGAGWKVSLDKKYAVFSRFGYALEKRFWSNSGDVWNTEFELHLMGPNWLRIDGHDVTAITVNNVSDDVLSEAEGLIEAVLTEAYSLSGQELVSVLDRAGVGHLLGAVRFVEDKQ